MNEADRTFEKCYEDSDWTRLRGTSTHTRCVLSDIRPGAKIPDQYCPRMCSMRVFVSSL